MGLEIEVPLQPKQIELLRLVEESLATWLNYGGSRGGSKSHGTRAVMLLRRLKHPGTRGLIFRRTFEQLWENHIQPLFNQYPFMREWYHTGHKELTLPNGSVIVFGYAEHPGDIYAFQGKQFMDIAVDEATHLTESELVFLKTCNRWPGKAPSECKMILTTNPGNVGHAFIKRVFIDHQYHDKESAEDYVFLQARAWDNVEWARAALAEANLSDRDYYSWSDEERLRFFLEKTDYGRTLDRLPQAMRIGHLLGSWQQFSGQFFDVFDPAQHVKRVESFDLRHWHPRWIGMDWGFADASVVEWCAQDDRITKQYREFKVVGMGPRALAQEIVDRSSGEKIGAIYLSPDAFAKRTSEATIAEQLGDIFVANGLPRPIQADNNRVHGWMLMYELLRAGEWQIGDNCTALIESLPMLTRDDKKVEDCLEFKGDDAADATRYALKSRLRPRKEPLEERIEHELAKLPAATSPTGRAMQIQRIVRQEKARPKAIFIGRRAWRNKLKWND